MGFAQAVGTCFRKYVTFSGRAARAEFWWFVLLWGVLSLVALLADTLLDLQTPLAPSQSVTIGDGLYTLSFGILWLSTVVQLAFLLPLLAVGSRRLHDRGASGWWQLILLISCCLLIPQLVLIFAFWILPSKREPNKYGPVPGSPLGDSGPAAGYPPAQQWPPAPPAGQPAPTQFNAPPAGQPAPTQFNAPPAGQPAPTHIEGPPSGAPYGAPAPQPPVPPNPSTPQPPAPPDRAD